MNLRTVFLVLLLSPNGSAADSGRVVSVVINDREVAVVRGTDDRWSCESPAPSRDAATIATIQRTRDVDSYPHRVSIEGRFSDDAAPVREAYLQLAPAAPIEVEGWGLEVSTDKPGQNTADHEKLRQWLASQKLPPDTAGFEKLHRDDSGRELRVWYEISGRRIRGELTAPNATARFDSLFQTAPDGWLIHHQRELFYHRESLNLVDTIEAPAVTGATPETLRSYQCGCYGWAIGGDWVTLGTKLYHVYVDWIDHNTGLGLFVGMESRQSFPWVGLGDRERIGLLARRALRYRVADAHDQPFAEIDLHTAPAPPTDDLGDAAYDVRLAGADGELRDLARIKLDRKGLTIELQSSDGQQQSSIDLLDALLAAMPTQVQRGDGIRDSRLGEIETLLDCARFVQEPNDDTLADLVSDNDVLTAVAKTKRLLEPGGDRFVPAPDLAVPSTPARATESPFAGR